MTAIDPDGNSADSDGDDSGSDGDVLGITATLVTGLDGEETKVTVAVGGGG